MPQITKCKKKFNKQGEINSFNLLGHKASEKTKRKMRKNNKGKNNPMYGKHWKWSKKQLKNHKGMEGKHCSKETKEKIRQSELNKFVSESTCDKISEALMNNQNALEAVRSKKIRKKIAISMSKYLETHQGKFKETSIEKIMECIIREWINYKIFSFYKKQIRVGRYVVDFLLDDYLIIECFGDYWHSGFAKKYKDMKRKNYLERKGYEVQIYWEKEINNFRKSNGERYLN